MLRDAQSFRFSLIQIPVWVTNKKGVSKMNLDKHDFKLYVDGRRSPIEDCIPAYDRPIEMVYMLDISGSMDLGRKLEGSLQTISYLLSTHQEDDRWKIVVFADRQVLQILDHTEKARWGELQTKIRAYGKTALFDALSTSDRFFSKSSLHNRAILLFTDGSDNQSVLNETQLYQLLRILDVPVFIVGIADGFLPSKKRGNLKEGLKTLQEITKITGGTLYLARSADELPEIALGLKRKLRPQYLLTMTVEQGAGDMRHSIEVKLKSRSSLQVRYRKGYIGLLPQTFGGKR